MDLILPMMQIGKKDRAVYGKEKLHKRSRLGKVTEQKSSKGTMRQHSESIGRERKENMEI